MTRATVYVACLAWCLFVWAFLVWLVATLLAVV